jgi:hypothetical protein
MTRKPKGTISKKTKTTNMSVKNTKLDSKLGNTSKASQKKEYTNCHTTKDNMEDAVPVSDTTRRVRRGAAMKASQAITALVSTTTSSSPSKRTQNGVDDDDNTENNTVAMSLSDESADRNNGKIDHGIVSTKEKVVPLRKKNEKKPNPKVKPPTDLEITKKRTGGVLCDGKGSGNNTKKKKKKVLAFADTIDSREDDNTISNKSHTSSSTSASSKSPANKGRKEQQGDDKDPSSYNNNDWRVLTAVDY